MPATFRPQLLHMQQLSSRALGGRCLNDITFDLQAGESHALLSTFTYQHRDFCDLLCGDVLYFSGKFDILKKPMRARRRLERTIQVFGLDSTIFPSLSVAENVALCNLNPRWYVRPNAVDQCLSLMRQLSITLDICKPVSALTQDEQRTVELLRICAIRPPIVVFFDATNYLSSECRGLIARVVRWLKSVDCGIVYLTSSFGEALEIGDRISILDSGTIRGTFQTEDVRRNPGEIAHLFSGWQPLVATDPDDDGESVAEVIADISDIMQSDGEFKRTLNHIASDLVRALEASSAILYLIDEARLNVIDIISSDGDTSLAPTLRQVDVLRLLQRGCEQILQQGSEALLKLFPFNCPASTVVCFPILLDGKKSCLIQLMFVQRREHDEQLSVYLKIFAREIAMAVETSRLLGNSVLLQETHHRIKNNLQMVHNLLFLQKAGIQAGSSPADAGEILDTAMHRIKCMASVHSLLCRDWYGRSVVNLKTLILEILQMYRGMRIDLITELDDISVPYNDAISLALVTNELVSNAIRHAFLPDSAAPQIVIELHCPGTEILLRVHDNGIGLNGGVDPTNAQSVGMSVIRSIVSELRGSLTYSSAYPQGTIACVRFSRESIHPTVAVEC